MNNIKPVDFKNLKKLHITEDTEENKWILSFGSPEFQGGDSIEIDEATAHEIMKLQHGA